MAVNDCQDDPTLKCWYYDDSQCKGVYEPFARLHCPLRCGYCPGKTPPCVDNIPDCADYGKAICGNGNFQGFLRENCRKFCGYCTVSSTTQTTKTTTTTTRITSTTTKTGTTPAPATTKAVVSGTSTTQMMLSTGTDCRDVRSDCQQHHHACVGVFQRWALKKCADTCGYCSNSPLCEDTVDCTHLPASLCMETSLRDFAMTSCRKYCGFCTNKITQAANMTTQGVPMTTPPTSMTSTGPMKIPTKIVKTTFPVTDGCPTCSNEKNLTVCLENVTKCGSMDEGCSLNLQSGTITAGCTANMWASGKNGYILKIIF
ncbi:integumentary mucin C.1-like [Saccostrea cucullata]|uniref:integumentary mucin C.1-like n=1 Tax=Saccostrea cuccullata TaxID=36930 RepID=UPI002ED122B8